MNLVPGLGNGAKGWGNDIWGSNSFRPQPRDISKSRGEPELIPIYSRGEL